MRNSFIARILAIAFCSFYLATSSPGAAPYHSSEYQYSVTIPDGWVQIPQPQVDELMSRMLSANGQSKVHFVAAFQLQGKPFFSYPYILIQHTPYPGSSEPTNAEMRQAIAAITGVTPKDIDQALSDETQGIVGPVTATAPQLDVANHRFMYNLKMQVNGIGSVRGAIYGFFGHSALISLNCYARDNDAATYAPVFLKFKNSYGFDPDAAYSGTASDSLDQARNIGKIFGQVVVFVAVIGAILFVVLRKKNSAA